MSNYTKSTNFAAKDSLPSGNANKVVKGTEINTEFDNIATAIATKADLNLTNATGLPLTTGVTGTLPVANGGTGATTFSAGALLKGAGTSAITTATAGTDYAPATSGTSILKGNGSGGFSNAASGTDYAPATSGTAILKGNGTGGFSNAAAGTDYAVATTGTSAQLLANSGSGGFSNVTVGSGLSLSAGTLSTTGSSTAFTSATSVSTTSGTSKTFTGIPSGTKLIIVSLNNVWITNGPLKIQLGTSGGIQTTSYYGGRQRHVSSASHGSALTVTDSLAVFLNNASAGLSGSYILSLENSSTNNWTGFSVCNVSDDSGFVTSAGAVALSGSCTQLRLTVDSGESFQAGSVNIMYSS